MINVFKGKDNMQYRTATVIKPDRTQVSFKYRKMSDTEIEKVQYLQGLRTQTEEFVISTTDTFDFNILSLPININGVRYKILDARKGDLATSSGLYRKKPQEITYMLIGR